MSGERFAGMAPTPADAASYELGRMAGAKEEHDRIVAWLKAEARKEGWPLTRSPRTMLERYAAAIEAGAHLAPTPEAKEDETDG